MNKKQWYEVFRYNGKETETVAICENKREANIRKKLFETTYPLFKFYIDKWEDIDNPNKIGDINL